MTALLMVLTPISLLDSTSMLPVGVVALATIFGQNKALANSIAFILGVFVAYLLVGVLALFGVAALFERVGAFFVEKLANPNTLDLILQIVIGIVLATVGYSLAQKRQRRKDNPPPLDISPGQAFTFAAGMVILGMPGAIPYFAAIDQVLRANLSATGTLTAMTYYNFIFVLPLITLVIIRIVLGEKGDGVFGAIGSFMEKWGKRLLIAGLVVAGIVLVADGIGWFFGSPILPVPGAP